MKDFSAFWKRFLAEKYTVILMADLAGKMKRFSIPKNIVKIGAGALGVAFIGFLFVSYSMLTMNLHLDEINQLRETAVSQKQEIQRFAMLVEEFENQMSRLEKFDKKLRIITALENNENRTGNFGVGGPNNAEDFSKAGEKYSQGLLNQLDEDLHHLTGRAKGQEVSFHELDAFFKDQSSLLTSTPSIWPTKGWVTSGFGYRVSPFTGMREIHEGLDIATNMDAPVIAPANGVVINVAQDNGYGNLLEIDHGYGIVTRYGHNAKVLVRRGDRVKRGQLIARVGSTGRSTGPHSHYEVQLHGVPVNPYRYILVD